MNNSSKNKINIIHHPLLPVVNKNTKLLILGSMPSVTSIEKNQYYGYKYNHFWHILLRLLKENFTEDYDERLAIVLKHNIGIWDVLASCERNSSLDKDIKNEIPNDIEQLLSDYPNIKTIACNGSKAYDSLKKYFKHLDIENIFKLPSSSPIPRKYIRTMEDKIPYWEEILKYI